MSETGARQIARDSLFVMADLRLDGIPGEAKARVRNLSAGGLMAETETRMARGQLVWVKLRNLGWVEGSIAWVQENRCGIAFREEIDPKLARAPQITSDHEDVMTRRPLYAPAAPTQQNGSLRKI